METAAIGQDEHSLDRDEFGGFADTFRNEIGRFDFVILHVDHSDSNFKAA